MKDLKVIVVGIFAILTTLALNFRHALNDYGVLDNKLHVEVLAQSNNSGGGSSTESGTTGGGSSDKWEGFKQGYTGKKINVPSYGELTCCVESSSMNACDFNKEAWGCQFSTRKDDK